MVVDVDVDADDADDDADVDVDVGDDAGVDLDVDAGDDDDDVGDAGEAPRLAAVRALQGFVFLCFGAFAVVVGLASVKFYVRWQWLAAR